jgi:hypothetical protein
MQRWAKKAGCPLHKTRASFCFSLANNKIAYCFCVQHSIEQSSLMSASSATHPYVLNTSWKTVVKPHTKIVSPQNRATQRLLLWLELIAVVAMQFDGASDDDEVPKVSSLSARYFELDSAFGCSQKHAHSDALACH